MKERGVTEEPVAGKGDEREEDAVTDNKVGPVFVRQA